MADHTDQHGYKQGLMQKQTWPGLTLLLPTEGPGQTSDSGEYKRTHNVDPSVTGLRPSTYSGTNPESSDSPGPHSLC